MAKKTLRDWLMEDSERKEARDSVKHYATFLKLWNEISEAYQEGWAYKEIWRVLERNGQIDFSYSSFINFARKRKRRQGEFKKGRARKAGNAFAAATATKDSPQTGAMKPRSGRSELPQFGQEVKPRDPKRF